MSFQSAIRNLQSEIRNRMALHESDREDILREATALVERAELRRAYVGGLLYKAEKGRLVELRRQRSGKVVELVRRELTDAEQNMFLATAHTSLKQLTVDLAVGRAQVSRRIPNDAGVLERIESWLALLPPQVRIALVPNVR